VITLRSMRGGCWTPTPIRAAATCCGRWAPIFAGHMTGQQARIELMLAIGDVVEAGRYEH
jgi:hypothetical protein